MKCDRLIFLVKNWYLKVQEEAMAPARMVAFMEKHISQCEECLAEEIVLPPSKVPKPKVVRATKDAGDEEKDEEFEDEEVSGDDDDDDDEDEGDDEDEDFDNDDDDEDDLDPDLMDEDDEI
jgi:hypothetical protein